MRFTSNLIRGVASFVFMTNKQNKNLSNGAHGFFSE